jgi:hypothetical protein
MVLLIRGAEQLEYYREHFADEQVLVELLPHAASKVELLWYFVGWNTLPTRAAALRRHMWRAKGWPLWRFCVGATLGVLGHLRLFRNALRSLYAISPDSYCEEFFDKYQPDLVFVPNMFSPEDFRLSRQARRRGVKTITTAKSWDVLTTKAFTRVRADRILVYNEFNRQEAVSLGDYSSNRITMTGFPQFDAYANPKLFAPREEFMRSIGADPNKPMILIAVPGDWKTPYTKDIIAELDRRIEEGRFGPLQVLARFHPKYPDSSESLTLKHFIFDRPGTLLSKKRETSIDMGVTNSFFWTFTDKDVAHLANSLKYSEVVINTESTISLDAAAIDRPIVLIGYDGNHSPKYWDSIARVYEREHFRHITDTGAAPLVRSHDELEAAIKRFLDDPDYMRVQRDKLREQMLYRIDGKATERVAAAILEML